MDNLSKKEAEAGTTYNTQLIIPSSFGIAVNLSLRSQVSMTQTSNRHGKLDGTSDIRIARILLEHVCC